MVFEGLFRPDLGPGQARARAGPGPGRARARPGPGRARAAARAGPGPGRARAAAFGRGRKLHFRVTCGEIFFSENDPEKMTCCIKERLNQPFPQKLTLYGCFEALDLSRQIRIEIPLLGVVRMLPDLPSCPRFFQKPPPKKPRTTGCHARRGL